MGIVYLFLIFLLPGSNDSIASPTTTYPSYNFSKRKPIESVGKWTKPPDIVICKSAPTTEADVKKAIGWWTSRGHRFGIVIVDSIHYGCIFGASDGYIIIELVSGKDFRHEYLGTTSMRHDLRTKEMVSAAIKLRGAVPERVLEHEIGHAMGFLHYNKIGHIMHENWALGGWDDDYVNLNLP